MLRVPLVSARNDDAARQLPRVRCGVRRGVHAQRVVRLWREVRGLKFGVYSAASSVVCSGCVGSLYNEAVDAQTYADAGVDYVKCASPANAAFGSAPCVPEVQMSTLRLYVLPALLDANAVKAADPRDRGAAQLSTLLTAAVAMASQRCSSTSRGLMPSQVTPYPLPV